MQRVGKRKKLAVAFTDEQAAWIEKKALSLLRAGRCHLNGGDAQVVREAVNLAMETDGAFERALSPKCEGTDK